MSQKNMFLLKFLFVALLISIPLTLFLMMNQSCEQEIESVKRGYRSDISIKASGVEPFDFTESVTYRGHYYQGESLHFTIDEEVILNYTLVDINTLETVYRGDYLSYSDGGIDLSQLTNGQYFISLNEKILEADSLVHDEVFYTVTRNGVRLGVEVDINEGYAVLNVFEVFEPIIDVYDILIDAGHGSLDGGASGFGLIERDEVLKVSVYIADRLTEHGLSVKLTRTDMEDPSNSDEFIYKEAPYIENGRVVQVYDYKANYVISNHLNAFDGTQEGFQIFSSVNSSDVWSSIMANNFLEIGREAFDTSSNPSHVSYGSYKYGDVCGEEYVAMGCSIDTVIDYYYILRETGGALNNGYGLVKYNDEYTEMPFYGAESIIVEYGFIDNQSDNAEWLKNWENWGEAIVKATVEYLNIEYVSP